MNQQLFGSLDKTGVLVILTGQRTCQNLSRKTLQFIIDNSLNAASDDAYIVDELCKSLDAI